MRRALIMFSILFCPPSIANAAAEGIARTFIDRFYENLQILETALGRQDGSIIENWLLPRNASLVAFQERHIGSQECASLLDNFTTLSRLSINLADGQDFEVVARNRARIGTSEYMATCEADLQIMDSSVHF